MKKYFWLVLLLILTFINGGCNLLNKKPIDDPDQKIQVLPVAPTDAKLGILVSYLDNTTYQGKTIPRIKIVTEQEFDNTTGYKFLGRAYNKDNPGRNGFGIALYEYYHQLNPWQQRSWGFKYLFGIPCMPGVEVVCPNRNTSGQDQVVAYIYSLENLPAGIVALYQYETPGGFGSGVPGGVSFTTDVQEIMGFQMLYGNIPVSIIGYIYHSTQIDRDTRLK